jgi:thioesterase domain-containing protein/acyl carrier protein
MMPSSLVYLQALPLTPGGKVNRLALPAPDGTRPELDEGFVAPRDALELQLANIWEKLLDIERIGVRDNFFDLGGHSLLAVRLFAQIEKLTGKKLPLVTLFQAPTVEQLAGILRQEKWEAPWSSLVPIQPGGSKPPFFGVHAHEGNILFYRDLARRLGPDQPFYGLQAQGLDGSQALHTSVEEMAAHYVKEIRTLQPKGPYFLGGYCFGGVLAFEMAQQLHAQGERVVRLALFDAYAPGSLRLSPRSISFSDRLRYLIKKVRLHLHNLSLLRPKEQIDYIKGRIKRIAYWLYTGTGLPFRRSRREILNAMSQASRNYRPQLYQGRVTLFRGGRELAGHDYDPQLGWGRLAAGGVEIHRIPSYDGTLFLEPHVRVLAEELARLLATHANEPNQQTDGAPRLLVSESPQRR